MVLAYYIKALESLQKALDSPKQRFKPEVLCATEILALYEVNTLPRHTLTSSTKAETNTSSCSNPPAKLLGFATPPVPRV
jgi:hypothetical protein